MLQPRGMIKFLIARVGDVAVAGSAELLYKDTIYGWYGGSDRSYSSYIPNDLLMWHVLEWGASNGYRVYDFGGAGKPDEPYGVRTFKAKYGGELVNYGRYVCVHSGVRLAISKFAYRAYQSARTSHPRGRNAGSGRPRRAGYERQRDDARAQRAEGLIDDARSLHVPPERRDEWNALVAGDPSFALLQSWEWGEFKERLGWKPFRIAAEVDGRHRRRRGAVDQTCTGPRRRASRTCLEGPLGEWLDGRVADPSSTRSIVSLPASLRCSCESSRRDDDHRRAPVLEVARLPREPGDESTPRNDRPRSCRPTSTRSWRGCTRRPVTTSDSPLGKA